MGNSGMQLEKHVYVQNNIFGMVIFVKKEYLVQVVVFIIKQFNNAFVLMENFGMDLAVWFNLIVVVERSGITHHFNVIVLLTLIGTEVIACYV